MKVVIQKRKVSFSQLNERRQMEMYGSAVGSPCEEVKKKKPVKGTDLRTWEIQGPYNEDTLWSGMSVLLEQIKLCRAAIVIMLQIIQALHSSPGGLFSTARILFFLLLYLLDLMEFFFFLHILPLTNQNCGIALGRTATGIITSSVSDSLIVNPDRLSLLSFFFLDWGHYLYYLWSHPSDKDRN